MARKAKQEAEADGPKTPSPEATTDADLDTLAPGASRRSRRGEGERRRRVTSERSRSRRPASGSQRRSSPGESAVTPERQQPPRARRRLADAIGAHGHRQRAGSLTSSSSLDRRAAEPRKPALAARRRGRLRLRASPRADGLRASPGRSRRTPRASRSPIRGATSARWRSNAARCSARAAQARATRLRRRESPPPLPSSAARGGRGAPMSPAGRTRRSASASSRSLDLQGPAHAGAPRARTLAGRGRILQRFLCLAAASASTTDGRPRAGSGAPAGLPAEGSR